MQKRCDRNRKRSKRRAIYCPVHGCHLHSVSQKYSLFADRAEQLQQRGVGRKAALMSMAAHTTVSLNGEWLEAFWCDECQRNEWYHVQKQNHTYQVAPAPAELWQQAIGVTDPQGNPSVGQFTRQQSRTLRFDGVKDFRFMS
ncbi:hypothetical protein ACKFKG_03315 [Phormidesmis sp. 146-35]